MNKEILKQYRDMAVEIKDIKRRIHDLWRQINSLGVVSDSVKGTRRDGTYGSIRITGYPIHEYSKKKESLNKNAELLETKETDLLRLMAQVEKYIESIPNSELRTMFRLYYMDGLTWVQVAHKMNAMYPKRRLSYTENSCKQRHKRFFEEN